MYLCMLHGCAVSDVCAGFINTRADYVMRNIRSSILLGYLSKESATHFSRGCELHSQAVSM